MTKDIIDRLYISIPESCHSGREVDQVIIEKFVRLKQSCTIYLLPVLKILKPKRLTQKSKEAVVDLLNHSRRGNATE